MRRPKPKAELYAKELDGARLRGDWASEQPTQLHGGSGKQINWPELVRKYSKHNPERQSECCELREEARESSLGSVL